MKNFLLLFTFLSNGVFCFGQPTQSTLDFNQATASILDEGVFFSKPNSTYIEPGYEIPKGSGINAIFSAGFWMAGLDQWGQLFLSAQRYAQTNQNDFYSGPYSTYHTYMDPSYVAKYSEAIWTVTKAEIEFHAQHFQDPGYVIPSSIQNWPGNGDVMLGVAPQLAPFIDYNGNLMYEPQLGEFPDIRGDKACYVIYNDDRPHLNSNGNSMRIEVHAMIYQFASNDFLNETTFMNMRVFNRGALSFSNFKLGFYMDADIGGYNDDFIGCDSTLNLMYTYNYDNFDTDYGLNPPALGAISLSHNMENMSYYTSTSAYPYNDPGPALEYWNFLNGMWANGAGFYYGNPYTNQGWSEVSAQNPPGDRRGVMTLEDVQLNSNTQTCYDMAIIYNRHGNHLENVQGLLEVADSIQQFYNLQVNYYNCVQVTADQDEISPTETKTIIAYYDLLGRLCIPEKGKLFLIKYSDGSIEKHLIVD
ncbi:MAG: hypothetical protein RL293_2149 [Bacteroidota bacterium]